MYERQQRLYFRLLAWLAGWTYLLFCHICFRFMPRRTINETIFESINEKPLKGIMVPWHCYVPYGWWMCYRRNGAIMVSRSNIGTVAAAITARLGCIPVRGGSRFGGQKALDRVVNLVRKGHWGVIVADGPRGPSQKCKMGPILAAQRSGRPLIPVAFSAKRKWTLNTWDRTIIPKPFSPLLWVFCEPFYVDKDLGPQGLEEKRIELERILHENYRRAQDYWNVG